MALISVKKTGDYSPETLSSAVAAHFESLGVEKDLYPGIKVLIKPNLLTARRPEQAVTTHPELIRAVILWLRDRGVSDITVADSSGGPYMAKYLETTYSVTGLKALDGLAKLNLSTDWQTVQCPAGFKCRAFNIISPVLKADYIINMPKLKTHSMTAMSGGIKNLFGTIPGLQKPEMHYRFPENGDFCGMLLELAQVVKPDVTLIDAVTAMEGNGPNGGDPRYLGVTLASRDIFAQDCAAARFMGIDPDSVPMLHLAKERGLFNPEDIELCGDGFSPASPPFKLPDTADVDFLTGFPGFLHRPMKKIFDKILRPMPRLQRAKCVGCGKCAESCPAHVIRIENNKAQFQKKGCISCFCCQEMCPAHAIDVKRNLKI